MKDGTHQNERPAPGEASRSKPGLADRVYHLLYGRISNGDYPANRKLPSENALADEFGVSRPVLRAALERLREQGLIHSRQGAGSYVREVKTVPLGFARVETIADIQRCYEFRTCIESMACRLAAGRRNAEALEEIETALSLMQGATDSQTHREDADFAFHLAIAKAATCRGRSRGSPTGSTTCSTAGSRTGTIRRTGSCRRRRPWRRSSGCRDRCCAQRWNGFGNRGSSIRARVPAATCGR